MLAVTFGLSNFSSLEAKTCKKRAVNAIENAQASGEPYASGCAKFPLPRSIIAFNETLTPFPNVIEFVDSINSFIILEPGEYFLTFGGLRDKNSTDESEIALLINNRQIATIKLPTQAEIPLPNLEFGDQIQLRSQEDPAKTAFIVIQRNSPV